MPRMAADFIIVHISMIIALAISVMYQAGTNNSAEAHFLITGFLGYYTEFFWLLCPLFPLVFLLNGFYTHSRAYVGRYKTLVIFRGVALAGMLFFCVNSLLFRTQQVGRSVALPFMILSATAVASVRIVKHLLS